MRVEDSDNRISLEYENQILTYKSLRYEDNGSYECHASNRFRIDSSVYNLNVVGMWTKINIADYTHSGNNQRV